MGFLTARAAPLIVSDRVFMTETTESSIVITLDRRNSVFKIENLLLRVHYQCVSSM